MEPAGQMSREEAGARAVFLATSDRYAVRGGGLVPVPEGLEVARKSEGGIFLVDPVGETVDNEGVLAGLRKRGVDEEVWRFTQKVFADCAAVARSSEDEL